MNKYSISRSQLERGQVVDTKMGKKKEKKKTKNNHPYPHEPFDQFGDFRQHVAGAQVGQRHRRFQDRPLPRPVPAFHRGHQGSFDLVDQGAA